MGGEQGGPPAGEVTESRPLAHRGPDDGPLRVLHVDDDSASREAFAAVADGIEVTGVGSSDGMRDRLAEGGTDCVVLDPFLPDANGLDLLREHPADGPPVVLLTDPGSESLAAEAVNAGATGYFEKGGSADEFREVVAAVERCACRYRRRRALERDARRHELVADVVTDAVFEWDIDRGFVSLDGSTVLGYANDDGVFDAAWWMEHIHPDDRDRVREEHAAVFSERRTRAEFDYRFRRADGEYAHLHTTTRFHYEGRRATYAVGAISDVTEQRSHEHELERQNERLDRFASVVSHDLRNPLAVANGYLRLARETGEEQHFDRTAEALDRIGELIDDLLELSRTGQGIGERTTVPLAGVATAAWEATAQGDQGNTGRLRIVDSATFTADRGRLRQLFENLFANAVEHGSAGSRTESDGGAEDRLTVSVGTLEDGFYVEDDGVGLPDELLGRLFETGVSGSEDGTGFGLAIVEEIVSGHGWDISAGASDAGGARFEVTGVEFD